MICKNFGVELAIESKLLALLILFSSFMVGVDICLGGCFLSPLSSFLEISLDIEISKENKEKGSMEQDDVAENLGKVALDEEGETCVDEKSDKLRHL